MIEQAKKDFLIDIISDMGVNCNIETKTRNDLFYLNILSNKNEVKGLSILGGEPMAPTNIEGTAKLAKAFKEKYPDKNVWAWSGYKYEQIKDQDALKYIDVLVDGNYEDELHDPTLKWKGSSNQRVIDVQKSLKNGGINLVK